MVPADECPREPAGSKSETLVPGLNLLTESYHPDHISAKTSMNLLLDFQTGRDYVSKSQIARDVTECWAERHLPCYCCTAEALLRMPNNSRGHDFVCGHCGEKYQLKSQRHKIGKLIAGASYAATLEAIRSEKVPNWILLQYDDLNVLNLVLIPRVNVTEDCVVARRPLSATARRAGWIGCNINLSSLAPHELIWIVRDCTELPVSRAREQFRRSISLAESSKQLGWALSVLRHLHTLNKSIFLLSDLYAFESKFQENFPNNKNIKAKIRQQLQLLRDGGHVEFLGSGKYRLILTEG